MEVKENSNSHPNGNHSQTTNQRLSSSDETNEEVTRFMEGDTYSVSDNDSETNGNDPIFNQGEQCNKSLSQDSLNNNGEQKSRATSKMSSQMSTLKSSNNAFRSLALDEQIRLVKQKKEEAEILRLQRFQELLKIKEQKWQQQQSERMKKWLQLKNRDSEHRVQVEERRRKRQEEAKAKIDDLIRRGKEREQRVQSQTKSEKTIKVDGAMTMSTDVISSGRRAISASRLRPNHLGAELRKTGNQSPISTAREENSRLNFQKLRPNMAMTQSIHIGAPMARNKALPISRSSHQLRVPTPPVNGATNQRRPPVSRPVTVPISSTIESGPIKRPKVHSKPPIVRPLMTTSFSSGNVRRLVTNSPTPTKTKSSTSTVTISTEPTTTSQTTTTTTTATTETELVELTIIPTTEKTEKTEKTEEAETTETTENLENTIEKAETNEITQTTEILESMDIKDITESTETKDSSETIETTKSSEQNQSAEAATTRESPVNVEPIPVDTMISIINSTSVTKRETTQINEQEYQEKLNRKIREARQREEERQRQIQQEEFEREQEQIRLVEEQRRAEEERLRRAIEERERENELKRQEEIRLQQQREELERRQAEEAERLQRERQERAKKEEEERIERKRRLDLIMRRTRQVSPTSKDPIKTINLEQTNGHDQNVISSPMTHSMSENLFIRQNETIPSPTLMTPTDTPKFKSPLIQSLLNKARSTRSIDNLMQTSMSSSQIVVVESNLTTDSVSSTSIQSNTPVHLSDDDEQNTDLSLTASTPINSYHDRPMETATAFH